MTIPKGESVMADNVTLRECLACHSMDVVIDKLSCQPLASVRCRTCGLRTRWDSREVVIAAWNTRVPDSALAAAQDEAAALKRQVDSFGQENANLREAWDAQIDKTVACEQHIAELEAELARLQEERRAWVQATVDSIRQTLPRGNP